MPPQGEQVYKSRPRWNSLSLVGTLGQPDHASYALVLIWFASIALCVWWSIVASGFGWNTWQFNMFGVPVALQFFYLPWSICILLVMWLGLEWAVIPAYLATLFNTLHAGVPVGVALVNALHYPLGLTTYFLLFPILSDGYALRSRRSWLAFVVASFAAVIVSSIGVFISGFAIAATGTEMIVRWLGWWPSNFLQSLAITAPLIFFISPVVERTKQRYFPNARTEPFRPPTSESNEAIFGILQDSTTQKQQEAALHRSERRYRRLMEAVPHGITEITVDGTITYANQSHHKMLGYQRGELIGKSVFDLIDNPMRQAEAKRRFQMMVNSEAFTQAFTSRYLTADKHIIDVQVDAVISRNEHGKVNGVITVATDITERVQGEQRLRYLAFYDPLTGLGNRALLNEHLRDQLANRRENVCVAVVLFNIDSFKMINDALGHAVGDAVLREFGARLATISGNQDGVARLGADEFAAVLTGEFDRDELRARVQEIKNTLEAPLQLSGSRLDVRLSVGVSIAPHDGNDTEELLRNADSALLDAKRDTPGGLRFYNAQMKALVEEFLMLRGRLRSAALQGEFYLEYQPQVELETGKITGLEALLRWRTEDGVLIPPGKFIPIAEQSGDIITLGGWVLETACRQGVVWKNLGIPPVPMTVNVSARQFLQDDLVNMVSHVLELTGFDPHKLQLELTETTLMTDNPGVLQRMQELAAMGISLSLDDFGTGYSSLSYLSRFPINVLKIDRSFVIGMSLDSKHVAIVSAIVAMSRALGLQVVAEGVEELRQVENLRAAGCNVAQGFYYSRPMSADSCVALLRAGIIKPKSHF